jgi:hypothetical protein
MALTVGTQLGSHEITALLGKGGMGEVYRAPDSNFECDVTADGKRFLINTVSGKTAESLTVVVNWNVEAKK